MGVACGAAVASGVAERSGRSAPVVVTRDTAAPVVSRGSSMSTEGGGMLGESTVAPEGVRASAA